MHNGTRSSSIWLPLLYMYSVHGKRTEVLSIGGLITDRIKPKKLRQNNYRYVHHRSNVRLSKLDNIWKEQPWLTETSLSVWHKGFTEQREVSDRTGDITARFETAVSRLQGRRVIIWVRTFDQRKNFEENLATMRQNKRRDITANHSTPNYKAGRRKALILTL